jgi:hypothetical protein
MQSESKSSKEGYGSKGAVLPVMKMMMIFEWFTLTHGKQ